MSATALRRARVLIVGRSIAAAALALALAAPAARAATTISSGTFIINDANCTKVGTTTTWNDTGTCTISAGATLTTQPGQNNTVANNDALAFAGGSGTITFNFNDNDTDFMLNGAVSSAATGAQTLAIYTGYSGNGDRESVTFNSAIPNATGGSTLGLNVNFRTQTGSTSWVNLPAVNTFTGPINLSVGSGPPTGYLTIGGKLTRYNGNTSSSGTLGSGSFPGAIALGASTVLNYASTATQTLSGVISGTGALQVTGTGALTLSGVNTYTGTTTVNTGGSLILGSTGALKFLITDAATNNKVTGAGSATFNGAFTLDTSAVTVTSGSWTLVNTTTKTFGGTFNLTNFTGPVGNIYTYVNGAQTWTFDKSTAVLTLNSKAVITAFGIPGYAGVINQTTTPKTIALTVPFSTNLATLAPTYTLTSGTCTPASGVAPTPTFATSLTTTYAATDGAVTNNYSVTVSKAAASTACDILACSFGTLGAATVSGTKITMIVSPSQSLTALAPTFTISPLASLSPVSGTSRDFSTDQTYTVTAENGSTSKTYTVSVVSYQNWTYNASLFILTTPDGANLPAAASETNFPLLVRLNAGNFDFTQAQTDGSDLRFATLAGTPLSYQIEQWDSTAKTAAVWVKIPTITGNARQEIKMYWGKTGVASESNGANVFNAANGYVSVLHMNETVGDVVGNTTPTDAGTTLTSGMIGKGRNFTAGNGILVGLNLTNFPTGSNPHSSEAWIRPSVAGTNVMGWGIEQGQGKVVMQFASPPHMNMDCYFGGGNVTGASTLALSQWIHVVHTYQSGAAKIYVNGVLDGTNASGTEAIPTPARMYIGGWYGYNYVGDMDEVRISNVTRSANWIKLEYENQKPLQTLLGNLVQAGSTFSASPPSVTINEGLSTTLSGQAGGAQKVYWSLIQNGVETVLATDQFTYTVTAARTTGNQSYIIRFKGIYSTGNQTVDIPVTVNDTIPDPTFTLSASTSLWDGRQTMTVTPVISNLAALQTANVANLNYTWSVAGVAVAKTITAGTPSVPGVLTLTRAQGSGPMTVTLVLDNGGSLITATKTITVQEPASDAWVQRTPGATEKAVNNQFYARDPNTNLGMIYYNGTGAGTTPVYLKVFATPSGGTESLYGDIHRLTPVAGAYGFSVPIAAGKVTYRLEFGTTTSGTDTSSATVTNLVCGDAYIIDGQSNALATDNAAPNDTSTTDPWIRTYGLTLGWGYAISKGNEMQLGLWGWYLAKSMIASYNMPVCFIQGAVGGTRIDQHQPNPQGHSQAGTLYSIYANIYNRVIGGNLSHGIRGVFWHQGENNSGAAAPTGDYDYKSYMQYFVDMSAAWKQDFPNIQRYIIYQVMPAPCSMGPKGDQLRDVQRTLPSLYSKMHILCTLGLPGYAGCHFDPSGYQNFANLTAPLVGQDFYGVVPGMSVTAPILLRAYYTTTARTGITLEFDQDMGWSSLSLPNYWLDKVGSKVASGSVDSVNKKLIKLQLTSAGTPTSTLDYLEDTHWSYNEAVSSLLYGANGIAALTFADVAIAANAPSAYADWAANSTQGLTAGVNDMAMADPDHDGIANLLEFALAGNPMVSSQAILPTLTKTSGVWYFEYNRNVQSLPPATVQQVEYGNDLSGWTPITIPATTADPVLITSGGLTDHVKVTLPASGNKTFVRLKITQP